MKTHNLFYRVLTIVILCVLLLPWGSGSLGRMARAACPVTAEGWHEVGAGSASGGGISANDGMSWWPLLAIAPDGTPYVAWSDDSDGDREIYVRRWNGSIWKEVGSGSASGGGISDNDGDSRWPSLAVAPDGRLYVAWDDDSGGDPEIYVRRFVTPVSADAGGPYSVDEGGSVTVTASGSGPDGDTLSFAWDLDSDGIFETPGQSVTFSAAGLDGPSSHTITVQVTTVGGLTATDQTTVEVLNVAPTVDAGPDVTIIEGDTFSGTGIFSDPGVDAWTATVDYGDGSGVQPLTLTGNTFDLSHVYADAGVYAVTVTVTDDDTGEGFDTLTVTVLTPEEALQDLIDTVESFNLQQGIENSLDAKLDAALQALEDLNDNNDVAAINVLEAFINAVEAQRGNKLTDAQADELVEKAQAVINSLS
jgi:hypothetical protein